MQNRTQTLKPGTRAVLLMLAVWLASVLFSLKGLANEAEPRQSRTLAVLSAFPVHYTDKAEDPIKRAWRVELTAIAVDRATQNLQERAALLTLLKFESGLASYVQEDRCHEGPRGKFECDSGKALGIWQLHGEVSDDLNLQAERALFLWRAARKRCGKVVDNDIIGAFSGYATGGSCGWGGATKRYAGWTQIWRKL